jgi:hopanoid biosynthesis associated RND transporter like protein HpnN
MIPRLLERLTLACARHALPVLMACLLLAAVSIGLAATRLGVTTDLNGLFSKHLPWKQREAAFKRDFPQFDNLIVAVIDARIPEEADATADALAAAVARDTHHFSGVRQPEKSPYFDREGLLFLAPDQLQDVLDRTGDAAPFLGPLAADPSARGLFDTLSLVATALRHGSAPPPAFDPALRAFHATLAQAAAGHPQPMSWQNLLSGPAAELAGPSRIVLAHPRLDFAALQPGGAATQALRQAAASLDYIRNGDAHLHITGEVPLADEEFSSAATGAAVGLLASFAVVVLWLYLALRSWRLILPVVGTLLLGLALTTGFAAAAVGTLNLISVAFAILFVGIAVDFAIQFTVRFREMRLQAPDAAGGAPWALARTGRRVGPQVLIASTATSAGFLAFVPTSFRGIAELGLIAGIGMLVALACTLTFLPATLSLLRPRADGADAGFPRAAILDRAIGHVRIAVIAAFAAVFLLGCWLGPRLSFDSNTLHTKPQHSEAMETLMRLLQNPVTNPFTVDVLRPSAEQAHALAPRLAALPLVHHTVDVLSLVPTGQAQKLAALRDAATVLAPVLWPPPAAPPPTPAQLRQAAQKCRDALLPVLNLLPQQSPLRAIAADMQTLAQAPDATVLATNAALVRFLPDQLQRLRTALTAGPVVSQDVPADLQRDYILPDGRARIVAVPKQDVADGAKLDRFVNQVKTVAPDAEGPAATIVATADTISAAFMQAAVSAIVAIALILAIGLRSLRDAALVLMPLLLSAAMTVIVVVTSRMTLNFANVIALPLLLGVGVSFNIYFVMNWRMGQPARLTSATTRAVAFSALTTGTAFGSLALSMHPGTASLGTLLLISLGCTLTATLVFVPALLGKTPKEAVKSSFLKNRAKNLS